MASQQQRDGWTADRLEDLSGVLKDFVLDFRADLNREALYARLYWLRRDIGKLVTMYGSGIPNSSITKSLSDKYGEAI